MLTLKSQLGFFFLIYAVEKKIYVAKNYLFHETLKGFIHKRLEIWHSNNIFSLSH